MKLNTITAILALSCGGLFAQAASAQTVDVQGAWARATVPGQKATGAFMKLTAKDGTKLVSVSTPAAGVSEVHEMKMDGDVMKMRAVQGGLDLPAGKAVELKPGGYHVMLMDLKAPLPKDSTVALTLVFKDAKGVETKQEVTLPVSAVAPVGTMAHSDHKH
ncbi:MAG: copper chaperone PCu(A)C [Rhodoferax sp.]|nr:copper chaperone PCu(A)C [Rhodoferax sp.]